MAAMALQAILTFSQPNRLAEPKAQPQSNIHGKTGPAKGQLKAMKLYFADKSWKKKLSIQRSRHPARVWKPSRILVIFLSVGGNISQNSIIFLFKPPNVIEAIYRNGTHSGGNMYFIFSHMLIKKCE